jgi:hypothetical protein
MIKLHRAVVSTLLGRQLSSDEFVCHRNDDKRNNMPENLYVGNSASNAADSVLNGGLLRGDDHPSTKIRAAQVRVIRLALTQGESGVDLALFYGCTDPRSAGSSTACAVGSAKQKLLRGSGGGDQGSAVGVLAA